MTVSAFDHPFLSGLLGDAEIAAWFSARADIDAMLSFEAGLAEAQAAAAVIPAAAARQIVETCRGFAPDMPRLAKATASDGVVVPALVRQLRQALGPEASDHVHFGATSQDVIDTSLMIRLKSVCFLLGERLWAVGAALRSLDATFGQARLMGHTRMQAAIPITVGDRLRAWSRPLDQYRDRLMLQTYPVQFGGPAGTLDRLGDMGPAVRAALADALGLADTEQWHSQRAGIAELAGLLSLITGSLGKIGQDIALMAQDGTDIELSGGGGSSAMPHKQNPVAAETLVTLARFNAVQLSGMHQALVHEQERSGAAWTLEWMILPQMAVATGAALRHARELLGGIRRLGRDA